MRRILIGTMALGSFGILGGDAVLAQSPGQSGPPASARPSAPDTRNPNSPNNPDTAAPTKVIDDKKFAMDAAVGGMTEVELGKLAAQKGESDGVKKFGQKMVDDHTKANDQLKEIAAKSNMEVPSALDSKHQARVDKLSKLSGADFDKAYIKDQLKDHKQDVSEFQNEAQNGTDPNIKQFASTTLPTLQEHLSMVQDLNKQAKGSSSK